MIYVKYSISNLISAHIGSGLHLDMMVVRRRHSGYPITHIVNESTRTATTARERDNIHLDVEDSRRNVVHFLHAELTLRRTDVVDEDGGGACEDVVGVEVADGEVVDALVGGVG
ncbi:hypothetical protein, partial [Kitasatospora sp. NPDC002965]|uniref:hypothetical protein n=1 Tax=Kitasatospora sp. NPDC002965 TaxID=3154775 RepID=UPI0033BBBEB6